MKKVIRIDENGLFVEDVVLQEGESMPLDCVETLCTDGFIKPKFDGLNWIEGDSNEQQ